MNLKNIETAIEFKVWFDVQNSMVEIDDSCSILKLSNEKGIYKFIQNKEFKVVQPKVKADNKDLGFYLQKGLTNFCQVLEKAPDDSVLIKINFFNGPVVEMGEIDIGIDEKIEKSAKEKGIKFKDINNLAKIMVPKFNLDIHTAEGKDTFFLMLSGGAANRDFESDMNEDIQSFSLYGEDIKIPVVKKQISRGKDIYFASRLMPNIINQEAALRPVKATLVFSDYTSTGEPQVIARGAMEKLLKDENSYLKKWDEYGEKEWEILMSNAQRVGRIEYTEIDPTPLGIKLFFDENIVDRLSYGLELEFTNEEPVYLKNKNITLEEFSESLEKQVEEEKDNKDKNKFSKSIFAKITKIEGKSIIIEIPDKSTINRKDLEGKFIILSTMGERVQIERRMGARKRVLEGRSANPQLGLIIEENGKPLPIARDTSIPPLTTYVKEKVFSHDPTPVQVKAIDIALNTPDIALIQGPPGTGKTTVVVAIIERLNQEHDKSNSIRGQILVTGFQHDAVENIISRLSINDLPTIKFGEKFGEKSDFSEDMIKQGQKEMIDNIVKSIKDKNPQINQLKEYDTLAEQFISYMVSPSKTYAKNLLELASKLPSNILNKEQIDEIHRIIKDLSRIDESSDNFEKIKIIRALRIREESFLDDGKKYASLCMDNFENDLDSSENKILKKAILWKEGRDLSFLLDLKAIKIKLLNLYLPQTEYKKEKPRRDIIKLIQKLTDQLENVTSRANKKDRILAEFLYELENNPLNIEEAISDYNYVFAATTQQSEGRAIREAKKKFNDNEFLEYDTVIVDEAARVSPRDLLIPMVQARKRIILVGDHRQLPHIIDEAIVKELENEDKILELKNEDEYIKTSMFAYLFNRLKKLDSQEKSKRGRVITLDAQYRMHPLLGKFTSDNFYEEYGEGYRSPLSENYFSQKLSGLSGKSAVWLNVSHDKGPEDRDSNKSRYRKSEAEAIAKQLKEWIDSEEGKELTFGVISFYRAQVNAVFDALEQYGITKNKQITDEYKFLKIDGKLEERIRIGTVDSFQGMEFDVVFLSMVRTGDKNNFKRLEKRHKERFLKKDIEWTDDFLEETVATSVFGHLMSENRLCVSVSRQKKVLVLVGDENLIQTELSRKYLPALYNFYRLAQTEGVVLDENS